MHTALSEGRFPVQFQRPVGLERALDNDGAKAQTSVLEFIGSPSLTAAIR